MGTDENQSAETYSDRYDRRLRIYEEVKRLLSIITRDANIGIEDLLKFRVATSEADFLFGSDVTAYIDELYKHAADLRMWARCTVTTPNRSHQTTTTRK